MNRRGWLKAAIGGLIGLFIARPRVPKAETGSHLSRVATPPLPAWAHGFRRLEGERTCSPTKSSMIWTIRLRALGPPAEFDVVKFRKEAMRKAIVGDGKSFWTVRPSSVTVNLLGGYVEWEASYGQLS